MNLNERLKDLPIPERMRDLPVHRGFPVPWFVDWFDGVPEFRAMDLRKKYAAVNEDLCWVCGKSFTTRHRYFVLGPMCVVNRNTSEPPCHKECAEFSARGCPFLSMPKMLRRENDLPAERQTSPGEILRNPGAVALYYTRSFEPYYPPGVKRNGNFLITLGEPIEITWWAEGVPATREQVLASIDSGMPLLAEECEKESTPDRQREARVHMASAYQQAMTWLPSVTA